MSTIFSAIETTQYFHKCFQKTIKIPSPPQQFWTTAIFKNPNQTRNLSTPTQLNRNSSSINSVDDHKTHHKLNDVSYFMSFNYQMFNNAIDNKIWRKTCNLIIRKTSEATLEIIPNNHKVHVSWESHPPLRCSELSLWREGWRLVTIRCVTVKSHKRLSLRS
jgi:hypothetical protein